MSAFNITRDWEKAQGVSSAQDLTTRIIRDYNIRRISIQNSATRPFGVAITGYYDGPTPDISFYLAAGEIKFLGVNSLGSYPQFIWVFDYNTKQRTNVPTIIRNDASDFVIRDGLNNTWIQAFKTGGVSASK